MGAPPGQAGWLVHLRDPSNQMDPQVVLSDSSVSTSEQTPASLLSRESAGHIIDPDKGVPRRTPFAVSVVANTGTASDALSTTLFLVGPDRGQTTGQGVADVAAIWVSADGQVGAGIKRAPKSSMAGAQGIAHHRPPDSGGLR